MVKLTDDEQATAIEALRHLSEALNDDLNRVIKATDLSETAKLKVAAALTPLIDKADALCRRLEDAR